MAKQRKRIVVYTTLSFIFIVGFLIVMSFMESRRLSHPLDDPQHGFTLFKPTSLPKELSITDERISTHTVKGSFTSIAYTLNLGTRDWIFNITEERTDTKNQKEATTSRSDFDPNSKNSTCIQKKSPRDQTYKLCHWTMWDLSVYDIKFIKDNTSVRALLPTEFDKPYSLNEIDSFVDSFKKSEPKKNIQINNNTI